MSTRFLALVLCLAASVSLSGCADPTDDVPSGKSETSDHDHGDHDHGDDDHDHGDHSGHDHEQSTALDTVEKAMAELEKQAAAVSKAMHAGDAEAAHEPLHAVGKGLEAIQTLIESADLSPEDKTATATAVSDLFDSFGSLDEVHHGGEEVDYETVEKTITSALATLKEKLN